LELNGLDPFWFRFSGLNLFFVIGFKPFKLSYCFRFKTNLKLVKPKPKYNHMMRVRVDEGIGYRIYGSRINHEPYPLKIAENFSVFHWPPPCIYWTPTGLSIAFWPVHSLPIQRHSFAVLTLSHLHVPSPHVPFSLPTGPLKSVGLVVVEGPSKAQQRNAHSSCIFR
jgi:hypothetical protein